MFNGSAHTGPQGDFGQVHFAINDSTAPLDTTVNIDCVNVFAVPTLQGGAWVGGPVTRVSPQPNLYNSTPGTELEFYLVDGGNPSSATPVDEYEAFYGAPGDCKSGSYFGYFPNVNQGNINISLG